MSCLPSAKVWHRSILGPLDFHLDVGGHMVEIRGAGVLRRLEDTSVAVIRSAREERCCSHILRLAEVQRIPVLQRIAPLGKRDVVARWSASRRSKWAFCHLHDVSWAGR